MTLAAQKSALRAQVLARRDAVNTATRAAASQALIDMLRPHFGTPIAGYHPMRGEADPLPALTLASAHGPVGLPVICAKAAPLRFRDWTPDAAMERGLFGAMIPRAGDWITPKVVIVPLVAFGDDGARLGYGGGFYDRTLQALRAQGVIRAIGFAFEAQYCADLPQEPTDQPLDAIVTEMGPRHGG